MDVNLVNLLLISLITLHIWSTRRSYQYDKGITNAKILNDSLKYVFLFCLMCVWVGGCMCVCGLLGFFRGGVGNILYGINKWPRDDKNNILNEIFWKKFTHQSEKLWRKCLTQQNFVCKIYVFLNTEMHKICILVHFQRQFSFSGRNVCVNENDEVLHLR